MALTDPVRHFLWRFRDRVRHRVSGRAHVSRVFTGIYEANLWGGRESRSGRGSDPDRTAAVQREVVRLIQELKVTTLLDAPCGDFAWMQSIVDVIPHYVGVDVVSDLLVENQRRFGSDRVEFRYADITADSLPPADLILCRDCLIHLPTRLIRRALANFIRSGATHLVVTTDAGVPYHDIPIGSWRPIDFTAPPFGFPPPDQVIVEHGSRQLGVWRLARLNDVV